jgi:hypothetical protein
MTAIFYPDCMATSLNGMFTLEARSPDNGTINDRNGNPPSEDDFGFKYREHQDEFRYRLIDNTRNPSIGGFRGKGNGNGTVIWERWQDKGEDSPHELVVSDDGWSILRTGGPQTETQSRLGKPGLGNWSGRKHCWEVPMGEVLQTNPLGTESQQCQSILRWKSVIA